MGRWRRTLLLGAVAAALAGAALAADKPLSTLYADPGQPDLSGLWVVTGGFFLATDRAMPALKGEYKTIYDKRKAAMDEGRPIDDVTADCLPAGMPHLLVVPYPFELMQTPGRVTMLYEYDSVVRRIPISGQHQDPKKVAPLYYGDSIGRWDGETFVIETRNIRDDTQLDYTGIPHSEQLTIQERMRRVDETTLESEITLTDPKAFEAPFKVTRTYKMRPKWRISEYECSENNRNERDAEGRTSGGVAKGS
jgi:hypothetical protein